MLYKLLTVFVKNRRENNLSNYMLWYSKRYALTNKIFNLTITKNINVKILK